MTETFGYVSLVYMRKPGEEKSTYTIIAECSAGHDTGTIYDYAEVIVESE